MTNKQKPFSTFAYKHWHTWQGVAKIMLSNENTKELKAFNNTDDCINYLFLLNEDESRDAARAFNKFLSGV